MDCNITRRLGFFATSSHHSSPVRPRALPIALLFSAMTAVIWVHYLITGSALIPIYGTIVLVLLAAKLVASISNRPALASITAREATAHLTSVALIPVYNEDPEMLARCLRSITEQTHPPTAVVVVDDGSTGHAAYNVAVEFTAPMAAVGINYTVHRTERNLGKRAAMAYGIGLHPNADLVFGVDSDTLLAPDALAQLRLPFADSSVTGATGLVLASNARATLLSRLIDLRYATAFLFERAAYSRLGSVLCCCGSLSAYRGALLRTHMPDFLSQTFLGVPAIFGDDRRLTNYALLEGKVVFQETAVAWTAVPQRLGHFARQQTRWSKSFIRESIWAMRNLPANRPGLWLSILEVVTWVIFTVMLIIALVIRPLSTGPEVIVVYAAYVALMAYARSVSYLQIPVMPGQTHRRGERAAAFALVPLYGVLHVLLVLPLRIWAAATVHRSGWGTRSRVEVTITDTESLTALDTKPPVDPALLPARTQTWRTAFVPQRAD